VQCLIRLLVAALVGVLIVLTVFLCLFVDQLTRTTVEIPGVIDGAIAREGTLTRTAATKQIENVAGKLDKQITALRSDLFARVDTIESDTFAEIDQVRVDANRQIVDTRTAAVAEIAKVSTPAGATIEQVQVLLPPAQHILSNASDTSDLLLDCDHNPDCLSNRTIGTLKAVEHMAAAGEKTMRVIADTTPETAGAIKNTSKDMATIVHEITKPTTWLKKVAGTAASIIGKFFGM
jgi:hypothetical protein